MDFAECYLDVTFEEVYNKTRDMIQKRGVATNCKKSVEPEDRWRPEVITINDDYFKEALIKFKSKAEADPDEFEPDVAKIYRDYGDFMVRAGRIKDAENIYARQIEVYQRLS
jgi:hypothetical protein